MSKSIALLHSGRGKWVFSMELDFQVQVKSQKDCGFF